MGYLTTALQGRALCPSATNVNGLTIYLPFGLRTGPNHPYPPLQVITPRNIMAQKNPAETEANNRIRMKGGSGTSWS